MLEISDNFVSPVGFVGFLAGSKLIGILLLETDAEQPTRGCSKEAGDFPQNEEWEALVSARRQSAIWYGEIKYISFTSLHLSLQPTHIKSQNHATPDVKISRKVCWCNLLCTAGEEEEKKKRKKKKKKEGATAAPAPAEEAKEQAMEAEPSEQTRKRSAAVEFEPTVASTQKMPGKLSEKKRRRSQTAEGSESEVPSKIRKTSESEGREKERDTSK